MRRVRLHWTKSSAERRCALVASQLLGEALHQRESRQAENPRLVDQGRPPRPEGHQGAGFHHMGGTRMADSPATGVVDSNCKVFGMSNLYIGGSSVFPTGGTPTRRTRSCNSRCGLATIWRPRPPVAEGCWPENRVIPRALAGSITTTMARSPGPYGNHARPYQLLFGAKMIPFECTQSQHARINSPGAQCDHTGDWLSTVKPVAEISGPWATIALPRTVIAFQSQVTTPTHP